MYFNGVVSPIEFQLMDGTTSLATLTSKLNELFPDTNNIKVRKIEFCPDWIDTNERVILTKR